MERTFDRLSALDSFFLDAEHEDTPMHIGAVCLFEEPQPADRRITLRRLRAHVDARLSLIPRYRQRLMRVPLEGHPVWIDCADFRISDHVRGIALPTPSSPSHLEETIAWIFSRPLSRDRPLWEIWLIEDLPRGGFALACKTHHCLADGLGGAALLAAILGPDPFSIAEPPHVWRPRPAPGATELLTAAVQERVRGAVVLAADAASHALFAPKSVADGASDLMSAARSLIDAAWRPPVATAFDRPSGSSRRLLQWSVALDDIKRIGRRLGGTVNDVALTLVSEAFAQTSARPVPGRHLRVYCPVGGGAASVSTTTLGNRVSGMLVDLPVHASSLEARWRRVVRAAREGKESGSVQGAFLLANLANSLVPSLLGRLETFSGAAQLFNLILTNVPGPQQPLYLFEQKMTAVCPLVPLMRGQGLGIAIFSYAGTLTWGFHVDAGHVDEARQLRSALAAGVLRLARLADAAVSAAAAERVQRERGVAEPIPLAAIHSSRISRERMASAAG